MPNNIASELQIDDILGTVMEAFREKIPSFNLFSTGFTPELKGTDKVQVPYYPLVRDAAEVTSHNPATGYPKTSTSDTETREVVIDQNKLINLSVSDLEASRQPQLRPDILLRRKGQNLAEQILADVLGLVTAANFAEQVGPYAANAFFVDDLQDIDTKCDELEWDKNLRGLILNHAYDGNLLKDNSFHQDAYGANDAIKTATLPNVRGFDIASTRYIPDNGENLVGMAVHPSAILLGFAPVPPQRMKNVEAYQTIEDPDGSGLTLEYKEIYDADLKILHRYIECNYGRAFAEKNGIVRIVSA